MNDDDLQYLISGPDATRDERYKGYRYCPRCRTELRLTTLDERERPQCPSCGFVYYQNPAPAAGAILVRDGAILLVRRSVHPKKDDWCIPAGFIEWNEHPQQTAVRELREETGLEISIRGIFDIFFGMDDPRTHAVLILYLADIVGGEAVPGDDAAEVRWFDFDRLPLNIAFQAHRDALALYRRRYPTR